MSPPLEIVFLIEESESHIHLVTFWSNGMVKGDRRVRRDGPLTEYKRVMEGTR